jgi:hypothetical protein
MLVADSPSYKTIWTCEKWSEEAVDFARGKLAKVGISHIPAELVPHRSSDQASSRINKLFSEILDRPMVELRSFAPRLMPITEGISSQMLRALVGSPEEAVEIEGNLLVNEGIQRFMDMTMIATLTGTGWNNANAFLGVGDSSTAEAATQTELQAATNRFYKAMNATFPSRTSQTSSFQSDFTTTEANYVWAEWTISSGATTASGCRLHHGYDEPQPQGCGSRYEVNGYVDADGSGHVLVSEIEGRLK